MKVEPRHVCEVRVEMTDLPKLKPNIHIPERLLEFCEMEAKIDKLEAEVERLKGERLKATEQCYAFTAHLCEYDKFKWSIFRTRWKNELRGLTQK